MNEIPQPKPVDINEKYSSIFATKTDYPQEVFSGNALLDQLDAALTIVASTTTWDFKHILLRKLHKARIAPSFAAIGVTLGFEEPAGMASEEVVTRYAKMLTENKSYIVNPCCEI